MISSLVKQTLGELKDILHELDEFACGFSQPNQKLKKNLQDIEINLVNSLARIKHRIAGADLYSIERDMKDIDELKNTLKNKNTNDDKDKINWLLNVIRKRQAEYFDNLIDDKKIVYKYLADIKSKEKRLSYVYGGLAASFTFSLTSLLGIVRQALFPASLISLFPNTTALFASITLLTFLAGFITFKLIENNLSNNEDCQQMKKNLEARVNNWCIGVEGITHSFKRFDHISINIGEEKQKLISSCDELGKQYKKLYDNLKSLILNEKFDPLVNASESVSANSNGSSSLISKDRLITVGLSFLVYKTVEYAPFILSKSLELAEPIMRIIIQ